MKKILLLLATIVSTSCCVAQYGPDLLDMYRAPVKRHPELLEVRDFRK